MNRADFKSINSCKWTEARAQTPLWHFRAGVGALLAILGSTVLAGCIVIPVDYHATGSRHNIAMSATNELRIGITTREDVLVALGEPDFMSEDGRRFGYFWTKVKAIWAIASYGSGAAGEITRSYLIETSFDPSNRVSGVRLRKRWGDTVAGDPDVDEVPEGNFRRD